jgi:hypothetical protein
MKDFLGKDRWQDEKKQNRNQYDELLLLPYA